MLIKKIKTEHLSISITKNSIINFEKRPTQAILKDYLKNGINSKFAKELLYLLEQAKQNNNIKTIRASSFLMNQDISQTIIEILKKHGAICKMRNTNIVDFFAFFSVSITTLNIRNLKRMNWKIKECKLTL